MLLVDIGMVEGCFLYTDELVDHVFSHGDSLGDWAFLSFSGGGYFLVEQWKKRGQVLRCKISKLH
jgi:hypothetical protein